MCYSRRAVFCVRKKRRRELTTANCTVTLGVARDRFGKRHRFPSSRHDMIASAHRKNMCNTCGQFANGTQIHQGNAMLDLHFWNEPLFQLLDFQPDLSPWYFAPRPAWIPHSGCLRNLWQATLAAPNAHKGTFRRYVRIAQRYGLAMLAPQLSLWEQVCNFLENVLLAAVTWLFDPKRKMLVLATRRRRCLRVLWGDFLDRDLRVELGMDREQ